MNRRGFLGATAGLLFASGCLETTTRSVPSVAENPPDAVYYPTHVEGMKRVATAEAGDYSVGFAYSFPHRFWTVTGTRTEMVETRPEDSVHLMVTVEDSETGTALPVDSGVGLRIYRDGDEVANKPPWPMVSQRMGFHYGDNYSLEGDATYRVEFDIGAMETVRRRGSFADSFDESVTATAEFDYSEAEKEDIGFRLLDDKRGGRGAVELAGGASSAPPGDELDGVVGEARSGDAVLVVVRDRSYVGVSLRTPYNGVVLPMAALSMSVERGSETVFDGGLHPAVGPELGYHYGADVGVETGDVLTIRVETPPQVSRHEGYETAFLGFDEVEIRV